LQYQAINCRKHSALLTDFGAVGDGNTSNTKAFKAAIHSLSKYAAHGGAQLIVPPGKWLTGSFNLTSSHFTLFLEKDAVILASQVSVIFVYFGKSNKIKLLISNIVLIIKKKNTHDKT
jgi:polygalacturonase